MDQPRRATVWWLDAHHGGEEYATFEEMERSHRPYARAETAWVVIDDERGVSLASGWLRKPDAGSPYLPRPAGTSDFLDVHFIPRGMIERIEYLEAIPPRRKSRKR